jgi:CheY-like chemotaxis protein
MELQNILVVDDHAANRKVLRVMLEAAGLSVFEAEDGVEALALLEREPVDAIISDILMPRMDGYRFCQEVHRSQRHKSIPLIFYTNTYTSPADEGPNEDTNRHPSQPKRDA